MGVLCTYIILQDRYRELMRVSRQYNDIKVRKWFGFGHRADVRPQNGELAIFCASCPQPGINLPMDWKRDNNKYAK